MTTSGGTSKASSTQARHANKPEPYRKRLAALLDGFDAHQVAWFLPCELSP